MVTAMLSVSCALPVSEERPSKPPVEKETEDVILEDGGAHLDVEASIAGWLPENADNVSQTIAGLIPAEYAVFRDIVATTVKTIIMTELELDIEHIEPIDGEDRYSARVGLGFPILLELPVLGKKEYWIAVSFDFVVEEGQVVDANIDASSFNMSEVND